MKRLFQFSLLAVLAVSCLCRRGGGSGEPVAVQKDTVYPLGFCTDSFRVVSGKVADGDNFIAWLTRMGVSAQDANRLVQACDTVFDVRKLRAGNTWRAYYSDSTKVEYVVYDNSRIRQTVFDLHDTLAVRACEKAVTIVQKSADVTIENSLWVDMTAAGAPIDLIVEMADI